MHSSFLKPRSTMSVQTLIFLVGIVACRGDGWSEAEESSLDIVHDDVGLLQYVTELRSGVNATGDVVRTLQQAQVALFSKIVVPGASANYGNTACRCVGIDAVSGVTQVVINGEIVAFPGGLGARCEAWDNGIHPSCLGSSPPSFCSQRWCFVDPCNCKMSQVPRTSGYMPTVHYQGKPIFYSYETCGSTDSFTPEYYDTACVNQRTQSSCLALSKCSWSLSKGCVGAALSGAQCALVRQNDEKIWGADQCKCIGLSGMNGSVVVQTLQGTAIPYPASLGSTCQAWHDGVHPACLSNGAKPGWCSKRWCFVDPCQCTSTVPRVANFLPEAAFQGNSMYYSFSTCGESDDYTTLVNKDACVNQMTQAECTAQSRCAWTFMGNDVGTVCRGREFATFCAGPPRSGAQRLPGRTAATLVALSHAVLAAVLGLPARGR